MKFNNLILTASALASVSFAQVTSDVVGYISLGADTGDAVPANTDVNISIPFVQATEGVYTVASSTQTSITIQESMTTDAFNIPTSGAPFIVEISSGVDEGIFLEIASNTGNVINLSGFGTEFLAGITAGDQVTVRQAWTLSTAFGSDLPDNTELFTYDASLPGINKSSEQRYTNFNGDWFNSTTGIQANDLVLYPGETFILRNNSSSPIAQIQISGTVTTTAARVRLAKDSTEQQDTRFSYNSPIAESIGESGLSDIANDNDEIFIFDNNQTGINKTSSQRLIFFGNTWFNATTGDDASNFELLSGQGYVYRRVDGGTTDSFVVDTQTYQNNL